MTSCGLVTYKQTLYFSYQTYTQHTVVDVRKDNCKTPLLGTEKNERHSSHHWSTALMETSWAGVSKPSALAVEEVPRLDLVSALWEGIVTHCFL